jgi:hypothetical protein
MSHPAFVPLAVLELLDSEAVVFRTSQSIIHNRGPLIESAAAQAMPPP